MLSGSVLREHCGHDRLFIAQLRRARHYRPPLQELRTIFPADRPRERGVLRASCSARADSLPGNRRAEAVDDTPVGGPGIQGVPQGIQAALRLDQGWAHHGQAVLRLERASQRTEKEMRPGYYLRRGILRLAEDFGIKRDMTLTV